MSRVARSARVASRQRVESITGNKTIETAETGETYIINYNAGATATITLPPKQDGAYFKFIFGTLMEAASAVLVITSSEAANGDFEGSVFEQKTGGSNQNSAIQKATTTSHHKLTLTADIHEGSWVECVCDGSKWYITGVLNVEAVGKAAFGT